MEFPCELLCVGGEDVLNLYNDLKRTPNMSPVIVGQGEDVRLISENIDSAEDALSALLIRVNEVNVTDWFSKCEAENPEYDKNKFSG